MADVENPVKQWMACTYKFLHNQYVKGHRLLWARAHRGKKQWRVPRANQYPCVGATNACMASDTFLRQRWHMRVQVFIYMSIPFKADSNDQTPTNWRRWGVSIRVRATIIVSRRQPHIYCRTTCIIGWKCMYICIKHKCHIHIVIADQSLITLNHSPPKPHITWSNCQYHAAIVSLEGINQCF